MARFGGGSTFSFGGSFHPTGGVNGDSIGSADVLSKSGSHFGKVSNSTFGPTSFSNFLHTPKSTQSQVFVPQIRSSYCFPGFPGNLLLELPGRYRRPGRSRRGPRRPRRTLEEARGENQKRISGRISFLIRFLLRTSNFESPFGSSHGNFAVGGFGLTGFMLLTALSAVESRPRLKSACNWRQRLTIHGKTWRPAEF